MPGMQPIRWDNVNGGTISDAARIMDSAGQSINSSFTGLSTLLKEREAIDTANVQNTKANHTTDFLNNLYGKYTDADALQTAMKSGDIAKQIAGYGYQIDSNAVRGAADARLNQLQQQGLQGIEFHNAQIADKVAPLADAYRLAVQNKDAIGAATALAQYRELGGKHAGDLGEYGLTTGRRFVTWGQDDKKFTLDQDKGRAEIQHMRADDKYKQDSLGLQREGLGIQRAQMYQNFMDHAEQQLARNQELKRNLNPVTGASEEGGKLIKDALVSLKDPAAQRNIGEAVAEFVAKNPNAPASAIAAGISTANQRWYRSDSHIRQEVLDNIGGLASAAQVDNSSKGKESARLMATETDLRLRDRIQTFQNQAYASLDPKGAAKQLAAEVTKNTPRTDQNGNKFVPVPEGTAPAYVRPTATAGEQPAGHYGPNGWEANAPVSAADALTAQLNERLKGAHSVRDDWIKDTPAAAQPAAPLPPPPKSPADIAHMKVLVATLERNQASGQPVNDTYLQGLKAQLMAATRK